MPLSLFKHLLPRAVAWRITIAGRLRELFQALADAIVTPIRTYFDLILLDLYPNETRELEEWELQFDLRYTTGRTDQERRDRVSAAWKALGGQDPQYIQDTLQNAGFDVYVHDWWIPGTEAALGVHACATPHNPFTYLFPTTSGGITMFMQAGEALAQAGEAFAQAGNFIAGLGYPLVNKLLLTTFEYSVYVQAGEALAQAGEVLAQAGQHGGFFDKPVIYEIPTDPATWAYFLYIGAPVFGDLAIIPIARRDEFEELILKIRPTQLWLGILVQYN